MDWSLNGYGAYVWPSYAITAAVLGGLIAMSVRSYLKARRAVRIRERARRDGRHER